jgi:predicted ATPase/class 3 adenylate cyclase/DNA-binding CsgD family transcriptional regulator
MVESSPFASSNEPGLRRNNIRDLPAGTVTLLFTDIEGSTRLLQQLGEGYAGVLIECRELLREAFSRHHGYEVDSQGDSCFVAFSRATDAVSAAVAAQRTLTSHNFAEGVAVTVRMGLHTGEPSVAAEGYIGLDVHHAARIMSVGHGGQVLLSQATCELVKHDLPEGVGLRDLGEYRLKDLQRPSHLYQLVITELPADFPLLKTLDSCPNNLPDQLTPLIGRDREVAAIQHLLQREDVRLVTLTGPGGIGKTRLGLQVAAELCDQFIDGVYFVNLAPISDPELVLPDIAQTLETKEIADHTLLNLLKASLRWKQVLLLLDNFEQVVDASVYIAELLSACPILKVIVTSRAALHVRGEQEFAVPPLAVPNPAHLPDMVALAQYEAVALFLARARAVKPDFQMTKANAVSIVEICARLDGLPLAIELAVARIKLLPPQALLERLGQRLAVLTSGARDAPARQQTLRNTIKWSYQLLDAEEQRLFRQLSVFAGGCILEAIEAVCTALETGTPTTSMLDSIASLIDKSILQQVEQEGEESRLVMLETIREYGLEALETSGEMEATRQAHAQYYLAMAEEAEPELAGPRQAVWLERLEREHDNFRAAMQWSLEQGEDGHRKEMALRLGGVLRRFWIVHGHWSEGRNFLERALVESKGVPATVQAKALITAANLANMQADNDRAEELAEKSRALCKEIGDTRGIALSLRMLAVVATRRGTLTTERMLNEEALALFREAGDNEGAAWSLYNLGWLAHGQGEYTKAHALFEESLALQRELGNKWGIAHSLSALASALIDSQDDPVTARALLEESLALSREIGDKEGTETFFSLSGQLALSQGDIATARSLVEKSLVINREIGNREDIAESLFLLGKVEARKGDNVAARALYEQSLAIAIEGNSRWDIDLSLEGLAGVVSALGEPAWAARLYGAAEVLRDVNGIPLVPVFRAEYESSVTATRVQLGEQAFAAAWAEGRTLTPEQALAAQGKAIMPSPIPARQVPDTHTPVKPPTTLAGLTTRELEVLRLLAAGLTDAQIAEQLVLSLHTVHAHLRTIYSKLGVTSRSAATRYAFEHQLV